MNMEKISVNNKKENLIERIKDDVLISDIPAIEEGGIEAVTRENLSELVEAPLLEACEELYDKNIRTVMSSANEKNVAGGEGEAYIAIDFDSLSEENKQIALKFGETYIMHGSKSAPCVNLVFPVHSNTTVGDIRRMAHKVVAQFHKQKMTWGGTTLDELAKAFGIPR